MSKLHANVFNRLFVKRLLSRKTLNKFWNLFRRAVLHAPLISLIHSSLFLSHIVFRKYNDHSKTYFKSTGNICFRIPSTQKKLVLGSVCMSVCLSIWITRNLAHKSQFKIFTKKTTTKVLTQFNNQEYASRSVKILNTTYSPKMWPLKRFYLRNTVFRKDFALLSKPSTLFWPNPTQ